MPRLTAQVIIAILGIALLAQMSFRANVRFRNEVRLPMQWDLDGSVIWSAPRAAALSLMPVIGTCTLAALVGMSWVLKSRPGQEWLEVPATLIVAGVCLGSHRFHIWMIGRYLRRRSL
jgi:hypothetical protein